MTDSTIFVHRYLKPRDYLEDSRAVLVRHNAWAVSRASKRAAKRKKPPSVVFIESGLRQQESLLYVFYKFKLVPSPVE